MNRIVILVYCTCRRSNTTANSVLSTTPCGSAQDHKLLPDSKMAVDYFNDVGRGQRHVDTVTQK